MTTLSLDGTWQVREAPLSCSGERGLLRMKRSRKGWFPARVPGEIHLDLMRAGRMPEPLVGLNAHKCRWPEKKAWWYRTTFNVSAAFRRHERQHLVFDGLDLYAQVFVNDRLVGESFNAFVPAVFDVGRHLRTGRNTLAVRLTAGPDRLPVELRPRKLDVRPVYGGRRKYREVSHLRKPQFSYGWDWVDALPNIGIWRGVRLEGRRGVVLHELRADTAMRGRAVRLHVQAVLENLHACSERACTLELRIAAPSGRPLVRRLQIDAPPGRTPVACTFPIPNPQLWWPHGMGAQPLYTLTARVRAGRAPCDRRTLRLGLRTVDIDRARIRTGGSRFCIRINGKDVFCKGGNWVPADAILARVSPAKYRRLIDEACNANCNMLRVWGGGIYEQPAFYEACDRKGILVWQDFMFACGLYPDSDPRFHAAVRAEAEAVVRMLRHHPSIVLWSGNNENLQRFRSRPGPQGKVPVLPPDSGGWRLYNQVLPDVCRALDPCRPYWPGSPAGGEDPTSETAGDCHWWQPATMNRDIARRIDHEVYDQCRGRFVSEYGVIGPVHLRSVKRFLEPAQRRVGSRAWREHTNTFEKGTLPAAITRHYADAERLDMADYILYGQMFQATMYGRSLEALRFRRFDARDDCQGALIWMYNDCWGEHGWTPIDYYLRRKPSYYWIRNALAPVKAIVRRRADRLIVRALNDTLKPASVTLHHGWMRLDGAANALHTRQLALPANSMRELVRARISAAQTRDPKQWLYAAWLSGGQGENAPSIWTLLPHRQLALGTPEIDVQIRGRTLILQSPVYCHGVHHADDGKPLFSDNYFDLLPHVPRRVRCTAERVPDRLRFRAIV